MTSAQAVPTLSSYQPILFQGLAVSTSVSFQKPTPRLRSMPPHLAMKHALNSRQSFILARNGSFFTLAKTQFPYHLDLSLNITSSGRPFLPLPQRQVTSRCVMPLSAPIFCLFKTLFRHVIICLMSVFPLEVHKGSKRSLSGFLLYS